MTAELPTSSGTYISQADVSTETSLTTTWTQKGGTVTTPTNAAYIRVRLYNYYNSGWAAFDDVSLVKVGTSTNLVVNPGFESSGSWTEVRNSSFPATAFWRGTGATASPRSGTYAYAISNHATGKLISNPITVTASSTYSLSAWLRGELDAEGSEGGGWNIQLCTYDVDQGLLGCTSAAVGGPGTLTTAWAQKSGTVSTPAGAVQARIQLSLEQGSGWAAFDDVSLVKVGNTTNLAPTPGFESTGGWSTSRDASFPGTSFYRGIWGTADGRSGDYGHVISSHMYGYLQSSAISATPGGVYDVYSWMRGELDADDSGGSWVLRVTFYNSSGTLISSSDAASGGPTTLTTAWQRKGGQVTAPAGTASLKVWLMVYMNSGWAAFDDVSVTQPQTAALTYDAENRLVSVSGSGMTASFVYDGDGNRVQSTINGVTTVYIGNYYEKSGDNITKYYYAGAMRVAMKSGSGTTWLLGDHLGSTSLAVNGATGQESSEQRYMPFGEVRYTSGTLPTKYTFTGQYSNVNDFGLMYYGARWYDVSLGRFAQADTIIPGAGNPMNWDRYRYVQNNPINFTDPTGHIEACEENCTEQRKLNKLSAEVIWKELIKNKFGVTISDDERKWDPLNLSTVYFSLNHIDWRLGGKTASYVKGAIFYLASSAAGTYHGWTAGMTITFYTSSNIPSQNVYHEFGHLLDNALDDRITTALGAEAVYWDGEYLFGGRGIDNINPIILKNGSLLDPNWVNLVTAMQHPSSDPGEQWADLFANLMSENIANNDYGYSVWTWVFANFR